MKLSGRTEALEVLFTAFCMVALLYTLAMAQLLNAEADCFQDFLDLSAVAAKEIVEVFLVNF